MARPKRLLLPTPQAVVGCGGIGTYLIILYVLTLCKASSLSLATTEQSLLCGRISLNLDNAYICYYNLSINNLV